MAELKRNFSKARMNKDVDERLVPPGEYRDAMNIEISTSEGANVGTAQTIKGNTKITEILPTTQSNNYGIPDTATCISSIADNEKNCIYYFVCSYLNNGKDYILRYDVASKYLTYLFVDILSFSLVHIRCTFHHYLERNILEKTTCSSMISF